ncbi:hypothetical protein CBL_00023 [Carabus blaptoides fortunei]
MAHYQPRVEKMISSAVAFQWCNTWYKNLRNWNEIPLDTACVKTLFHYGPFVLHIWTASCATCVGMEQATVSLFKLPRAFVVTVLVGIITDNSILLETLFKPHTAP